MNHAAPSFLNSIVIVLAMVALFATNIHVRGRENTR
jgi:hypothetical protein